LNEESKESLNIGVGLFFYGRSMVFVVKVHPRVIKIASKLKPAHRKKLALLYGINWKDKIVYVSRLEPRERAYKKR